MREEISEHTVGTEAMIMLRESRGQTKQLSRKFFHTFTYILIPNTILTWNESAFLILQAFKFMYFNLSGAGQE